MSDKLANATGISYQMRQTTRDHPGVFLWKDKDVTLKGIDFRFLHGFGVVGQSTDTITMDGLNFGAAKAPAAAPQDTPTSCRCRAARRHHRRELQLLQPA